MNFKSILIALVAATTTVFMHTMDRATFHDAVKTDKAENVQPFIAGNPSIGEATTTAVSAKDLATFHSATRTDKIKNVQPFIDSNPEILNQQNEKGTTALHVATQNCCYELIRFFIEKGANPNLQDLKGNTPLHEVMMRKPLTFDKALNAARNLLENGANPNIQNQDGDVPLHFIGQWSLSYEPRSKNVVKKLFRLVGLYNIQIPKDIILIRLCLDHNADPYIKNKAEMRPFWKQLGPETGFNAAVDRLLQEWEGNKQMHSAKPSAQRQVVTVLKNLWSSPRVRIAAVVAAVAGFAAWRIFRR